MLWRRKKMNEKELRREALEEYYEALADHEELRKEALEEHNELRKDAIEAHEELLADLDE